MHLTLDSAPDRLVFAAVLIDASGSMKRYQGDVIDGHQSMLVALRNSEEARRGALYIHQCLFADQTVILNLFVPVDSEGLDQVCALDRNNYEPNGATALYDAIMVAAGELETQLDKACEGGRHPVGRMVVMTDGQDGHSRARLEDVHAIVRRLHARRCGPLQSSVVVLLKPADSGDASWVERLPPAMGFSQKISLDQNSKDIRRAFIFASKFVVELSGLTG